jgi:hypothetical protein
MTYRRYVILNFARSYTTHHNREGYGIGWSLLSLRTLGHFLGSSWDVKHWAARLALKNFWPWSIDWCKPGDRRQNLVKAGALIIAEIERLDRAALQPKDADHD